MKNIAKNFMYQTIFQLVKIIIPIVTIPIVSGALGPEGVGIYNYTFSITQYFVLASGLGVTIYGNREIAIAWNKDKANISKTFWEIFIFKFAVTCIFMAIYFLIILFSDYRSYFFAQGLIIISVLLDISWFFMGIEDFKKTSLSNLVVQFLTLISIIIFVKDSNDTLLYTLIQSIGLLLSQLLVWIFVPNYIQRVKVSLKESFRHFFGAVQYFIPQVAISLYTNLNKTLLGIVLGSTAVGYYTNSLQLSTVFITIITTLDLVLLPHMTGLYANKNTNRIIRLMENSIDIQLFFSIPIMFGMLTVYDKLVPWFFGEKFLFVNQIIPYFSILIVIVPLGMAVSRQYLMPVGKVKEYNKSVILGAIINIISSGILLPSIGFFGVVFSNILAEFFVTLVRLKSFLKDTDFIFKRKNIIIYVLTAGFMCILVRSLTLDMDATLLTNIIQLIMASAFYFLVTSVANVNPVRTYLENKYSR